MNFADNFKQEQKTKEYKGSGEKKKACASAEGGGRVNINVRMDAEELDDTIKLTKKEICQSAVCSLGSIYHIFKSIGRPIDFKTRDFIDTTVSQVIEDIFMLDEVGGSETMMSDVALETLFEAHDKNAEKEEKIFSEEDWNEDEEGLD